jgi:hypothetical protein
MKTFIKILPILILLFAFSLMAYAWHDIGSKWDKVADKQQMINIREPEMWKGQGWKPLPPLQVFQETTTTPVVVKKKQTKPKECYRFIEETICK